MSATILRIGKPAPLFEGDIVKYDSRKKKVVYDKTSLVKIISDKQWTVLFFYPRDFSSLCPTEIHSFNRRFKDFEKANAVFDRQAKMYKPYSWLSKDRLIDLLEKEDLVK